MELPKTYNPKEVEDKIYRLWEKSGFFTPEKLRESGLRGLIQKKFVVAIAPPNITGELHMGHALENTLVDIIVRTKRMQGYEVLWVPGLDHAGIAAQNMVEKELAKEGLTRHDLGREKFLERMWQWKEKYGTTILEQLKKLGLSIDFSRTRFTLDDDYKKAVNEAFLHYWQKGWIYRGWKVINWCPRCQTAISDLEVEYRETKGKLYFVQYPLVVPRRIRQAHRGESIESQARDDNDFIVVATTRPETMLGDAGVAVHPQDERYKSLIGKKVLLPIQNREIPIIADNSVDMHFGTGAVKVTPAHSVDDFEISERHKLQIFEIIDKDGKMTKEAGPLCEGLLTGECRTKVVEKLKELGLLEKTEGLLHNVGHCERCGTVIEPLFSKQWFLKMSAKGGGLAELAKKAVKSGSIKIHPQKWEIPYFRWLDNIRDWNISRQIWWGHKIPLKGEEDVLDTWFSSALWPFAVLGWPNTKHYDYKKYYPTQFISSGRDILHLWITRMIFSGMELAGKEPFKNIYIHPTVLTKEGRRMSKSLGTGIDPLGLIDKYGADALRFGLAYQATGVQDMRFNEDVILTGKKFANKLWNITRYVLIKISNTGFLISKPKITDSNKMILERLDQIIPKVTKNIENYEFGDAAHRIYDFVWHDFADKFIEETKNKNDIITKDTLAFVLMNILKILHPFMPFVTEEIWSKLPIKNKNLLLIEPWPK